MPRAQSCTVGVVYSVSSRFVGVCCILVSTSCSPVHSNWFTDTRPLQVVLWSSLWSLVHFPMLKMDVSTILIMIQNVVSTVCTDVHKESSSSLPSSPHHLWAKDLNSARRACSYFILCQLMTLLLSWGPVSDIRMHANLLCINVINYAISAWSVVCLSISWHWKAMIQLNIAMPV